jgi:hypothetical protein
MLSSRAALDEGDALCTSVFALNWCGAGSSPAFDKPSMFAPGEFFLRLNAGGGARATLS